MIRTFLGWYGIFISAFVGFMSGLSLLTSGIPPTHDGEYHVLRFAQFYKVFSDGVIYPRWAPDFNNGFGIPLFNYVYPLPNYVSALLHFFGFSFIDSFKLSMILASLIGAVFFYLWTKSYWGKIGGMVSSVIYTLSPYHLVDIYVRGSVGEVWALAIFPMLLWSYVKFLKKKNFSYFTFSCISLALLVFSHNILAVIFFMFFLAYATFLIFQKNIPKDELKPLLLIILIGFGIAAPFWLPVLTELRYVQGLQIFDPTHHFPEFYQLIIPSWGYGLSPSDLLNPMSVQIGIANLAAFIISFCIIFISKNAKTLLFFILSFIIVFLLMMPISTWIWKNIPLFSYFQFPWRLLSLEILVSSFLAGSILSVINSVKTKAVIGMIIISIVIALSYGYARGATYYKRNDNYYLTRSNFVDSTNSPGNSFNTKWLTTLPKKTDRKFEFVLGNGKIEIADLKPIDYKLKVVAYKDSEILVNTAFFPGWVYKINGKKYNVGNLDGKIQLVVPKGTSEIEVILENTPVQKISYVLLLASVLLLLIVRKTGIIV